MLRPDQLTNIRSRELNIDIEKEKFEEVNVQLSSSSDDEHQKNETSKKSSQPKLSEKSTKLEDLNQKPLNEQTKNIPSSDGYPDGMLLPEQLTNIKSRELVIDLEKEHFEEVNVQLSSSDDEKPPKSKSKPKPQSKPVERSIELDTKSQNEQTNQKSTTNAANYPPGMLLPEQLTNITSRELVIDLEKEHFDEVNVQLSSSDDEKPPKSKSKPKPKRQTKPVERSIELDTKPQNEQTNQKSTTNAANYPPGMLLPEQLTNIKSRELVIDLEKEHFEEVNVQLSSSDDEKPPKSKSKPKPKQQTKPVERSIELNAKPQNEQTNAANYPPGMLLPEQLTNITSRELVIDLEKEHFDEVNVQLSSSDDEKPPKSKSKPKPKRQTKPVERSIELDKKPQNEQTNTANYPPGMLLPEQLTNITSRELVIDLEKEHFEEVNVQLSSSDDEKPPKSKSKPKPKQQTKPIERSIELNTKPQNEQTNAANYPPGMLLPEQLTNITSRELVIDLEKEHFEEVNVQLSSSDDEKPPKSKSKPKQQTKPVERSIELNTKPQNEQTNAANYPPGMLLPEQLTNIKSRELVIDLEKEHFEEVNVQLSSSDDEKPPKSKSKPKPKQQTKPVERSIELNTKSQNEQTNAANYPPGMLLPEQLTNIKSRELVIDLEKEHFEEVNVQLSSSDDEKPPKSKSKPKPKQQTKPVERSIELNAKPQNEQTNAANYPPGMLLPEQLTNITSRELVIDLEKEHFDEVNVQLSSSDDEEPKQKPTTKKSIKK